MASTIDSHVQQFAELHHGVFALEHLDALGASAHVRKHRVANGRWQVVHDGVYRLVGHPVSWRGRLLAACWAAGSDAVASHRSSAELWALPSADRDRIEITCRRWKRTREPGLVVHESLLLEPEDVTTRDRIPVTTVARTLFDLAALVGPTTLDIAFESALRRRLTSMGELSRTHDRLAGRGRRGTARFRTVLETHAAGDASTESEAERLVLLLLQRHGLPAPITQHEIRDSTGRFLARVDFAYPELKIAIEYDSYLHHTGRDALVRDSVRRNAIVATGWLPITATGEDLRNGAHRLVQDLRRARSLRTGVTRAEEFRPKYASS